MSCLRQDTLAGQREAARCDQDPIRGDNTGVGWRQIVENMYQNAKVADWYKEHGKHAVYANVRKMVPLPPNAVPVTLHVPKDGRLIQWAPKPVAPAREPGRVA